jgi:hypothetical protein
LEPAVSRSYSELGWLLDGVTQAMVKNAIQKSRKLLPEESDASFLEGLLSQLEEGAEKLSSVLTNAPELEKLRVEEATEEKVDRLVRSALDDVASKS